jgi:hypothetical protein
VRRRSKECAQRARAAKPIRDGLRERVGRCELCGKRNRPLACHEISRGPLRQKSLDRVECILVVCPACHELLGDKARWPEARQLAVLRKSRPGDYDLVAYNELVNPRAPNRITQAEVEEWK